jgi:hypothetical protein
LVESGSRHLLERFLAWLQEAHPEVERADLVTCFPGLPAGFDPNRGQAHRVSDYITREQRNAFLSKIRESRHDIIVIICSDEPLMTKWKWALAAKAPSKLLVLNENGDFFWIDYTNWRTIIHFVLFRAGLTGADAVTTIGRVVLFPFTFTFLLLYAAYVHTRRLVRI